jgi:hypothetical protein
MESGFWLGAHGFTQRPQATVESGLGGPDRDIEDRSRLGERPAEIEVDHDDRALLDWQSSKLPLKPVPFGDLVRDVGGRLRLPMEQYARLDEGPPPVLTGLSVAGPDR